MWMFRCLPIKYLHYGTPYGLIVRSCSLGILIFQSEASLIPTHLVLVEPKEIHIILNIPSLISLIK